MLIPGQRVHLVGIGGAGMSAIARVMLRQGYTISGSDRALNPLTEALARDGAVVHEGHRAEHVGDVEAVIISSAVAPDNPEVLEARRRGLPVLKRQDILGDLMRGYTGVAVAGTHGKTTTTSMIVHILVENGLDPTYIIGGVAPGGRSNAGVGQGGSFIIEADEYDHMFLGLRPQIAVITNIEHDHPDLFPTLSDLVDAFTRFVALLPPEGLLVVCADNMAAMALGRGRLALPGEVVSYGLAADADWRAADWSPAGGGMTFALHRRGRAAERVNLRVPGVHNIQNALAALIVADRLGAPLEGALSALATFTGAGRRFEIRGQASGVTVIDDYAHHPTAIRLTLAAARQAYPDGRIWAVWQPHTYSRLRALFDDFAAAFDPASVDQVLVTEVYAAREKITPGPGAPDLIAACQHPAIQFTPTFDDAVEALAQGVRAGDVVLILSAGDAPEIGVRLLARLGQRRGIAPG